MPITILTILTVLMVVAILWFVFSLLPEYMPGRKKVNRDIGEMRKQIEPHVKELLPLKNEELELLSFHQTGKIRRKGITRRAYGVFNTIYHEPVVAYSYKKYPGDQENAILYARTARHEYIYRTRKGETALLIDGKAAGAIREDGGLYSGRNKLIARVESEKAGLLPVQVREREVAQLVQHRPGEGEEVSPRALEFVRGDLSEEEEKLFLSLAILQMVKQSL